MAGGGALGSLTVKLGLDAAEFTGGLSKADYEAQKFAQNVGRAIEGGVTLAVSSLALLAAGAVAAFAAIDSLVKKAGDFQDLAEKTGASAEALASFAVAAGTAGTTVEAIAQASIKLTKSLVGIDDESKAAGAAVSALGLNLDDFKKLKPEDQISAVSKALAGFKDGAEKTAVATALFGKSGAELLPFLKELENQGGRTVILTEAQIKAADDYADKQAKLTATVQQYAQSIATEALPIINQLIGFFADMTEGIDLAAIASTALKVGLAVIVTVFQTVATIVANTVYVFQAVGREIGAFAAQAAALARLDLRGFNAISAAVTADGVAARADLDKTIAKIMLIGDAGQIAATKLGQDPRELARRGRGPAILPTLNYAGAVKPDKATKEKTDEGQKYLEKLQAQLDKTRELTTVETLLSEIQSGRLKLSGKVTQEQLVGLAKVIDATKEASRVADERQKQRKKDNDDALKASQEIEEADRSRLKALTDSGPAAQLEKQRSEMIFLAEAFEKGKISAEQFNDAATGYLDLKANTEKTKSLADELNLSFTSAFEDAIVGGKGLSDVLKGLEADLIRIVTRQLVTKPLGDALGGFLGGLGGGGSGGGLGGLFTSALGFITGKASGGPVSAGSLYRVAENGPETLDVGGDQYLMTGSKGGIVRPGVGGSMSGGPRPVNITYNSAPGESRKTAAQNGAALSRSLMFADQRGN